MAQAAGEREPETVGATAGMLASMPAECWQLFVPKEKVIMVSMASKGVKAKMEGAGAAVEVHLNLEFWYEARRSNEAGQCRAVLQKVGALAKKYRVETLGLPNFGVSREFGQLAKALEECKELKCLELERNDFGAALKGLISISSITSLTTLNLKQHGSTKRTNCTLSLSDVVAHFPHLAHLSLEGNNIGAVGMAVQSTPLRTSLRFLCLKENWLRADGLLRVKEVLVQCPGLTHLDLSENAFGSREMDALVGMFAQCTLLSYLSLAENDMDHDVDADLTLASALAPLKMLTDLKLQSNRLGGLRHMGVVLAQCAGLEYLDLSGAMVEDSGATILARVLSRGVRYLNVSSNRIGATGTEALAGALAGCDNLNGLNMSGNLMWQRGAQALGAAIGNVKLLCLSNCGLGAGGCRALAGFAFARLEDFDVSGNCIHGDGVDAIAGAAGQWQALKTLCVSSNALGASGMRAVVRVLANYAGLTKLQLSSNNVQDEGIEILAPGLAECAQLQELSLSSNNLSDAGATCLAGVLSRCPALTELFVSYNDKIGPAGVQVLRDAEEGSGLKVDVRKRLWRRPVV